jgi:hypothetical protein
MKQDNENNIREYVKRVSEHMIEKLFQKNYSALYQTVVCQKGEFEKLIEKIELKSNLKQNLEELSTQMEYFTLSFESAELDYFKSVKDMLPYFEKITKSWISDDELCPASPFAISEATWEEWYRIISPFTYFESAATSYEAKIIKGVKIKVPKSFNT